MKILLAALTAVLTLALVELSLGGSDAKAAAYYSENYCKNRYNLCLARCPDRVRCFSRCLTQYRYCTPPAPALGDLL
jgi:hypothetical protein